MRVVRLTLASIPELKLESLSEAQSFRREDNGSLPLTGQRSVVLYDFSAVENHRGAKGGQRLCKCTLGCLHDSRIAPRSASAAASIAESGINDRVPFRSPALGCETVDGAAMAPVAMLSKARG